MDALKVYDVKKICDARLYIVDMAAAYVRALATVLLMGRVAVLDRYRAVPVARLSSCSLHPNAAARLSSCSLHPRAAARPLAAHAASLRLGASARSPARPCRRPRAPQPPACRRGATPPTQASSPPPDTAASRALHGHHQTHPRLVTALRHRSLPRTARSPPNTPRPRRHPRTPQTPKADHTTNTPEHEARGC